MFLNYPLLSFENIFLNYFHPLAYLMARALVTKNPDTGINVCSSGNSTFNGSPGVIIPCVQNMIVDSS